MWDIFYYIFLKAVLNWPDSLLTWDILFLIPVPWVGPVIAPCLVSLTMILLTLIIIFAAEKENHVQISWVQWLLLISGGIVLVFSFMWDYLQYVHGTGREMWTPMSQEEMFYEISHYVPESFNWFLFSGGEILLLAAVFSVYRSVRLTQKSSF